MKTTKLIKGKIYNSIYKTPTDTYLIYVGTKEIYTYFDFETKYIFKVYQNKLGKELIGSEYRLIYLSEYRVNELIKVSK